MRTPRCLTLAVSGAIILSTAFAVPAHAGPVGPAADVPIVFGDPGDLP